MTTPETAARREPPCEACLSLAREALADGVRNPTAMTRLPLEPPGFLIRPVACALHEQHLTYEADLLQRDQTARERFARQRELEAELAEARQQIADWSEGLK